MEGYQFTDNVRHLTRPQIQYLAHVFEFKMELKYGKPKSRRSTKTAKGVGPMGVSGTFTPEKLHEKLEPKFAKMDKEAREREIANAQQSMREWSLKHQKRIQSMRKRKSK